MHSSISRFAFRLATLVVALVLMTAPAVANPQPGLPPPPADVTRTTPQDSLEYFLQATRDARFDHAAYILDLRGYPRARQPKVGAELARKLRTVLDRKLRLDPSDFSSDPAGNAADGAQTETVGQIALADQQISIKLVRVPTGPDSAVWVFSRSTVRAVDDLYDAYGPGMIGERLPEWYQRRSVLDIALWQWIAIVAALFAAAIIGGVGAWLMLFIGRRIAVRTKTRVDDALVAHLRGPIRLFIGLWVVRAAVDLLRLSLAAQEVGEKVLGAAFVLAVAWAAMRVVHAIADVVLQGLEVSEAADETLVRRGQQTRIRVGRQFFNALILFVGVAVALTQFEVVRKVGVSLLASAGIVGVVLGFAAQKSVANLVAGIQISIAQPIRIGDRVHISGDIGWIEEITLTYVTMKTWDGRRRVFPITFFIENQFENWTKTSAQLIGQVLVHADYSVPVAKMREKLLEFVRQDPDWDGEVAEVLVVDTTAEIVILRVTASSADAPRSWALRCRVRERALGLMQELESGRYLPRKRVELPSAA
ncbi:MAG: mechanosensitive ion channel [Polyangiaceae bacterium]